MNNDFKEVKIDTKATVLSSHSLFYKTENFIKDTMYISEVDSLLVKLCEGILGCVDGLLVAIKNVEKSTCFSIRAIDLGCDFLFRLGCQVDGNLNKSDIVFFGIKFLNSDNSVTMKIDEYIDLHPIIVATIKRFKEMYHAELFSKLYLLYGIAGVNLPRLNSLQKEIVESVDKNVVVQGVAGSGKTNICIDKIIFTACKNYSKKTLYSTFSRGLLIDTKLKVELYKKELESVLKSIKNKTIKFLDSDHKKALENRLGIYFFSSDDNDIIKKLEKIIYNLTNNVDYMLIEDMYQSKFPTARFVGQDYFINSYCKNMTNHQMQKVFNKLTYSKEIIYKEIYGMILGSWDIEQSCSMVSLQKYIEMRQNSISRVDCESIYLIACDFIKHCEKNNLLDNNSASRILLKECQENDYCYALTILDEVQDYTQVNLALFAKISLKMFCVGDALQMINPSYFTFGYLKNLLYKRDTTDVKQLKHNYRNSSKIEGVIKSLEEINKREFGTHNFIVEGESVDSGVETNTIYVTDKNFAKSVANSKFDNFTFVVADENQKNELLTLVKNQEVLTVSEIKGLERPTIVAYNILSSNIDKWKELFARKINHKTADENSVYRYYYNLFYVALTRAKQNVFVVESMDVPQFQLFFKNNFELKNINQSMLLLENIVKKVEFTQKDLLRNINEFIRLEQWDNARRATSKIKDNSQRVDMFRIIEVYENFVHFGKYREAGVKLWEYGLLDEAKKQFILSGDTILIELIERCSRDSEKDLSIDIINYFCDVEGNQIAREFILETAKKDLNNLKSSFANIKNNFKKGRR